MSTSTGSKVLRAGCLIALCLGGLVFLVLPRPAEVDALMGPEFSISALYRRLASLATRPGPTRLLAGIIAGLSLLVLLEHAVLPFTRSCGGNAFWWRLPSLLLALFTCALASVFTVGAVHELGWLSRTRSCVLLVHGQSPDSLETLEPVRKWAEDRLGMVPEEFRPDPRRIQETYQYFCQQVRELQPTEVVITNALGNVTGVYFWFARPHPQVQSPGLDAPHLMPAGAYFSKAGARYAGTADLATLLAGISRDRALAAQDERPTR